MNGGGSIELEGLDKLMREFRNLDKATQEATIAGLEAVGADIVGDAVKNIRHNKSWVSGALAQSGRVERKGLEITVGFFDTENESGYAMYYEFGRRAGKMPPPDEIGAWAYKKLHLKGDAGWKAANSIGWAIAKRIAREGTQPHPFFVPAINKNTKEAKVGKSVKDKFLRMLRNSTASMALRAREIRNTPVR